MIGVVSFRRPASLEIGVSFHRGWGETREKIPPARRNSRQLPSSRILPGPHRGGSGWHLVCYQRIGGSDEAGGGRCHAAAGG